MIPKPEAVDPELRTLDDMWPLRLQHVDEGMLEFLDRSLARSAHVLPLALS